MQLRHWSLQASARVQATDEPVIVKTKQLMEGVEGVVSLAQGVVHWSPPQRALDAAVAMAATPAAHRYGPAEGMPALRQALKDKVARENGLHNVRACCTGRISRDTLQCNIL
jgi:aromatic aminotransferase